VTILVYTSREHLCTYQSDIMPRLEEKLVGIPGHEHTPWVVGAVEHIVPIAPDKHQTAVKVIVSSQR
jgi:hypothetical protein